MKARIPKGVGGGGPANMNALMRQYEKFQNDMAALTEELEAREYEISAGGGAVKVKINGKKELVSVEMAPEVVDPDDTETLADILIAAVNEAIRKVETVYDEETQALTARSGLPSAGGLGF